MRILGPIVRLQIQRSSLKVGHKPHRRYDPAPLFSVDRLQIDPDGAVVRATDGDMLDVHHRRHPATKNHDGENTLSIGFTAHYRAMRSRYGEHLEPGCAGENILVDTGDRVTPAEIHQGFLVLAPGGAARLRLVRASVAHPCKPFSGFAHRYQTVEPEVLKDTLQFLDAGMRGYYCAPDVAEPVEVRLGDILALP